MKHWLVGFVCLLALCYAEVEKVQTFPVEKELVYNVHFNVHSGVRKPMIFASYYSLKAKLHVQGIDENNVALQLSDIVYKLGNGQLDNQEVYFPIQTEAEALKLPFKLQFEASGQIKNLEVEQSDKNWSINMKKSIASSLQINRDNLVKNGKPTNRVEITTEPTIYGDCDVAYHINSTGTRTSLMKSLNLKGCVSHFNFIDKMQFTDTDNNRAYEISLVDGHHLINHITSISHLVSSPQIVPNDVFTTGTFQEFQLTDNTDIKNKITITSPKILDSLVFINPHLSCEDSSIYDVTAGRANYNPDHLITKVNEYLDAYLQYFDSNHITFSKPNIKNVTLLQKVLPILEMFDLPTLEKCFASMPEKTDNKLMLLKRDFFVQLLPYIGTHASVKFIRDLIANNKISLILAADIVSDFPDNLKCANEKFIIELEDMLTFGADDSVLRRSSVLSFANLVHIVFKENDQSPLLEKYIKLLIQKLTESKEYQDKVLYLEALSNIQIGSVFKYLEKIVNGEVAVELNLRTLALYAIAPKLIEDGVSLIKTVLPILADRQAHLDLRLAAYYAFVKTKRPTLNLFMNLHYIMLKETNEKFYSLHYSTLKAISELECNTPEKCELVKISKAVLKLSRKPLSISESYSTTLLELIDSNSGLELNLENMLLYPHTGGFTLRTEVNGHFNGLKSDVFSLYMNFNRRVINVTDSSEKISEEKLDFYECIVKRNGRTIVASANGNITTQSFLRIIGNILPDIGVDSEDDSYGTDSVQILDISHLDLRVVINDLGVPIRIYEITPVVMKLTFDEWMPPFIMNLKLLSSKIVQTAVYNPVNNLWHGIQKINYFGFELPLNIDFDYRYSDGLQVVFYRNQSVNGIISAQNYMKTQVFIEGDKNQELLSQSAPNKDVYQTVTRGDSYRKDIQIESDDYIELGRTLEIMLYDCEQDISRGTFVKEIEEENYFELLSPSRFGTCGTRLRLLPIDNVSKIILTLEMDDTTDSNTTDNKNLSFETKGSLKVKTIDKTNLRSYNLSVLFSTSETSDFMSINADLVRKDNEIEVGKMNLNFLINLMNENLMAELNMTLDDKHNVGEIYAKIIGSQSNETSNILNNKEMKFRECEKELIAPNTWSPVTIDCLHAATSLRHYSAVIDVQNPQNTCINKMFNHLKLLKAKYHQYLDTVLDHTHAQCHVDVIFPVFRRDEADIILRNKEKTEIYTGVPISDFWFKPLTPVERLAPQLDIEVLSFVLSTVVETFDDDLETCIIAPNYVLNTNNYLIRKNVSLLEWQSYFKNEKINVLVKSGDKALKTMAVEINIENSENKTDIYQIFSKQDKLVLTFNGQERTLSNGKDNSIPNVDIWSIKNPEMIHINFKYPSRHTITFDGQSINLNVPLSDPVKGVCIDSD